MTIDVVLLKEVLHLSIDSVPVDPAQTYPIAGVYSFARGLLSRSPILGSETTYKTLNRLHRGDFVLSQLKGWEGALAKVTAPYDGWYLSPQFPTFRAIPDRLDISYLEWYCKQANVWDELRATARGMGARRDSVSPERFLSLKIPLPPVPEQRRMVARIEELAAKINEARTLRIDASNEAGSIIRTAVTRIDQDLRSKHSVAPLESFASGERGAIRSGPFGSALLHSEFVVEGIPAIGIQDVQENRFELTRRWNVTPEKAEELRRYTVKPCDILVTVMGTLGRACVVPYDIPRMVSTKHVWTVTLDESRAEPKWISYWLNFAGLVRDELLDQGTGTAIPGLNGEKIRALSLPDIPILEQQNIVAELDALHAQVDALNKLQAESAAELDALLPSILDKAFRGKL